MAQACMAAGTFTRVPAPWWWCGRPSAPFPLPARRAYRGVWVGTEVCVKVVDLFAPLSPAGGPDADGPDADFPAAPLLEAALSKALAHPNIASAWGGWAVLVPAPRTLSLPGRVATEACAAALPSWHRCAAEWCACPPAWAQVPTHAWAVSEGEINAQGKHHSQVWIVQSLCTLGTLADARDRGLFQDVATQGPDLRAILLTVGRHGVCHGPPGSAVHRAATSASCPPTVAPICSSRSPLPASRRRCVQMRDVAAALQYLHSVGVTHGDLSGNNVLLRRACWAGLC